MNKIVAVCVSYEPKTFHSLVPFVNQVNPIQAPPRRTVERVKFVANERNLGIELALKKHPDLTHILMIDSLYLDNAENNNLWLDFTTWYIEHLSDSILGASCYQVRDIRWMTEPQISFVEIWSTPEGSDSTMVESKRSGLIRVQAVGSVYIFPINAWYDNHYKSRDDYFLPEHIDFCRNSGLPIYLSFTYKFFKSPEIYSLRKKLRITAGYLRRKYV